MMEMGKLWEDAAKTAEASVTSFLSRNSAERTERNQQPSVRSGVNVENFTASKTRLCKICSEHHLVDKILFLNWNISAEIWATFQHILLHFNLVELVGADNDAVAGEVDTAAGLRRLNLLQTQVEVQHGHFFKLVTARRKTERPTPYLHHLQYYLCFFNAHSPFWCRTCWGFHWVAEL